jgi:redox-sensitive bicupin YhaK (pirin superfamily)
MSTSSIARPGVSIRRGADRHQTRIGWLHGRHSFDTGIDPYGTDTHHGVIYPNLAQRMTAGSGIRHSEKNDLSAVNPDAGRPVDLSQMWVVPDEPEVTPGYEQLDLDPADFHGRLGVVASGMAQHRDQDAARLTAAGERRLTAADPSEVLIWEMHADLGAG